MDLPCWSMEFTPERFMKTIIAGSRSIIHAAPVLRAIQESRFHITEVVSGMAPGVDTVGRIWAEINNIPVKEMPADWAHEPRYGGINRNHRMAEYAEALIAVWDGKSKGTSHMIDLAKSKGIPVFVWRLGFE